MGGRLQFFPILVKEEQSQVPIVTRSGRIDEMKKTGYNKGTKAEEHSRKRKSPEEET